MNYKFENIDCMIGMAEYEDNHFDLAIVDPPYGIKRDNGFGGSCGFGGTGKLIERIKYGGDWDSEIPSKEYFDLLLKKSKNVMIFGGNYFTHLIPQSNHWIFWDKMNTMPTFGDGELIYTNIKRNSVKKYTLEYNGLLGKEVERIHPTQKPIALYKWLITKYAKEGDLILDTHVGSASNLIAFEDYGFEYVGFELDKDYYEAAQKRLKQFRSQLKLAI